MNKVNIYGYAISDGTSIKGSEEGPSTYFNSAPYKKLKKCLPNKFQEFIHTKPLSKIAVPPTFEPIQFPADIINKKITLKYRPATPFDNVLQNCRMLAIDVAASIAANQKFITIGGDHSMAIGTWSGAVTQLESYQDFGLIWIDAHLDAHTPNTTITGSLHGQPLAHLLGKGNKQLVDLLDTVIKKKLDPRHVCIIGARSFEDAEHKLLKDLGVKIFYYSDVATRGINSVWQEALQIVNKAKYFGVTIDLDAFDSNKITAVSTPAAFGIDPIEFLSCVDRLCNYQKFIGLEIAEYNPRYEKASFFNNYYLTSQLISDIIYKIFY